MKLKAYIPTIVAGLLLVLGVGLMADARLSNTPPSGQASDADLTTLSSPTANRFVYATSSGYSFEASSTVRDTLLSVADRVLSNLTATSTARTNLGLGTLATLNSADISDNTNLTAGRSLTLTGDDVAADAELFTHTATISMINPTSSNNFSDGAIAVRFPSAATVTEVGCHSLQAGTTTIQLDERAESTPGTAGTDILSAVINCGITFASTSAFANATIAATSFINLDIDTMVGSPSSTVLYIDYTLDD